MVDRSGFRGNCREANAGNGAPAERRPQAEITRRRMGAMLGMLAGAVPLAACGSREPSGAAGGAGAKRLSGQVEFWSNAGYAYTGKIGGKLVEEFQAANPGLTVAFTDTTYSDFMTKLVSTSAAGNPPDLSYADRYVTKSFACLGVTRALDDYMKGAKNAKPTAFWPRLQHDITYKGKVWAVPHGPDIGLLYLNKNIFRESGLDPAKPPTTWDDAATAIQRLSKRSGTTLERAGWAPLRGWGVPWMVMYWQLGGELTNPEERQAVYNNAQAIQVFEWISKVYDAQGGNDAIVEAFKGANPYDAFAQGRMAMVWATFSQWRTRWEQERNLDVGFTYWPTPPNGRRSNYMGGWSLIVPKQAKNPDGAFHFLDYLSGNDPQIRWSEEWNNVPATKSAAESDRYIQNNPVRRIAVAEMPNAKWVITAPGGDKALTHQVAVGNNVVTRKFSIRDALAESVKLVQEQLDEAQRNCGI
jgi:multiple sugar transport system substrate-binding protein